MGAELFRADRRIDMTKLMVAFRNFANAPKICLYYDTQADKILIPMKPWASVKYFPVQEILNMEVRKNT